MQQACIEILKKQLSSTQVLTDTHTLKLYSQHTSRYQQIPLAVVLASSTAEVKSIVKLCHDYSLPITVRGGGTGTTGAAVPLHNGIVLSLERMNKILKIDPANRAMIVEAGVTNQTV